MVGRGRQRLEWEVFWRSNLITCPLCRSWQTTITSYNNNNNNSFYQNYRHPLLFHLLIVCLKYLAYYKRQARNFGSVQKRQWMPLVKARHTHTEHNGSCGTKIAWYYEATSNDGPLQNRSDKLNAIAFQNNVERNVVGCDLFKEGVKNRVLSSFLCVEQQIVQNEQLGHARS